MAYQGEPPKYVQMVDTLKRRITTGAYPLGSKIPSESELCREFDVSRQVVVRALLVLEQDGWLRGEQGRGRFVLGVPEQAGSKGTLERLRMGERISDDVTVKLLHVGPVKAPARAAFALEVKTGTPVLARQRLLISAEVGPVELSTTYVSMDLVTGTDLGKNKPLAEGALEHLRARKRLPLDHATDRISARLPTTEEASLLELGPRDAVLTVLVSVYDRDDTPRLAVDITLPASRHEIEDIYSV